MQQLQSRGGGVNSNSGVMSERAAWMALVEDLKKRCAVPVQAYASVSIDWQLDSLPLLLQTPSTI